MVILVGLCIDWIFYFIIHRTNVRKSTKLIYGFAEWQASSTLQLQRIAHENLGLGRWKKTNETIPVTGAGERLGILDVSDHKHARMIAPTTELDNLETPNSSLLSQLKDEADPAIGQKCSRLSSSDELSHL
jgi:hypothetical protein